MTVHKYDDCEDCYFNDQRVPEMCEECFNGDCYEPQEDAGDDYEFSSGGSSKAKVIRIKRYKEAA